MTRKRAEPSQREEIPTLTILGVRYARLNSSAALAEAERLFAQAAPAWIAIENVHAVNLACSHADNLEAVNRANLVLNDGKGVMLAALIQGSRFPADLNGNFFGPLLLERAAQRGWRVFLLGAEPGIAPRAAQQLMNRYSGLVIAGTHDGYFSDEEKVIEQIRFANTDLLLVGMGMPRQERWLDHNLHKTGARLGVTVGAFLDFQAGKVPRAPAVLNRLGFEWVYRLIREPRRLWRRYLIGNPLFLLRVLVRRVVASSRKASAPDAP